MAALVLRLASEPAQAADDLSPLIAAAERALAKGDANSAVALFTKLLEPSQAAGPTFHVSVLRGLLQAVDRLVSLRQFIPAVEGLTAAALQPLSPLRSQALLRLDALALDLILSGQPALAEKALRAVLGGGEASSMRMALLARAMLEQGAHDQCAETLKRGLEAFPGSAELLFMRASLASTQATRAIAQLNLRSAENLLLRARRDLEVARQNEGTAAGISRALGKVSGSLSRYHRVTGQPRLAVAEFQIAEEAYSDAARLDRTDPEIPQEIGQLLLGVGDWVYAERLLREALLRSESLLARTDLSRTVRDATAARIAKLREQIGGCWLERARTSALRGRYADARGFAARVVVKVPELAPAARRLQDSIERCQRREVELRQAAQGGAVADAIAWGDHLLRRGDFEEARAVFGSARLRASEPLSNAIDERLRDTEATSFNPRTLNFEIGSLAVIMQVPETMDTGDFTATLEKAHASMMGQFPYRLAGPLDLVVFPNLRVFLERAGPGVPLRDQGLYTGGQVLVYASAHRSQAAWLKVLSQQLARRYIDEQSFGRAPVWLAEGLARCLVEGFPKESLEALERHRQRGLSVPWAELETALVGRFGEPAAEQALLLEAQQIADWLLKRFGAARLMTLFGAVRQEVPAAEGFRIAFGAPLEELEKRFAAERR